MELISYKDYHERSMEAGDVDPSIKCLEYLADRFELNMEQRYWIAWLYGMTYCATTVFFIYNEFPDYHTVDLSRMERWWAKYRNKLLFQTDRLRIKSNNQFIDAFKSYREQVGDNQEEFWQNGVRTASAWTYQLSYHKASRLKFFGRFSIFNYLDTLYHITNLTCIPDSIKLREADSCRNGLAFAIGRVDLMNHNSERQLTTADLNYLQGELLKLQGELHGNVYQIETTLCAYKKYRLGKRFIGYYIERMRGEIQTMSTRIPEGVCWNVLYQFRLETYQPKYLNELEYS